MRRAGRVHGLRAIARGAIAAVLAATGVNAWKREADAAKARADAAKSRVEDLLKANTIDVAEIIQSMEEDRRWTDPQLKKSSGICGFFRRQNFTPAWRFYQSTLRRSPTLRNACSIRIRAKSSS